MREFGMPNCSGDKRNSRDAYPREHSCDSVCSWDAEPYPRLCMSHEGAMKRRKDLEPDYILDEHVQRMRALSVQFRQDIRDKMLKAGRARVCMALGVRRQDSERLARRAHQPDRCMEACDIVCGQTVYVRLRRCERALHWVQCWSHAVDCMRWIVVGVDGCG